MQSFGEKNTKNAGLVELIKNKFPIDYSKTNNFELYPLSNEDNFPEVLAQIGAIPAIVTDETGVAIFFGESNFLSILPEISKQADLILLADIQPDLHKHTAHLLDCLLKTNSKNDFLDAYVSAYDQNNGNELMVKLLYREHALGEYFFLSEKRFKQCKEAAEKLCFVQIHLDLTNLKQCHLLSNLLHSEQARFTFCNFTNIHFCDDLLDKMNWSVPLLLQYSPNCTIIHSDYEAYNKLNSKELMARVNPSIQAYCKTALKFHHQALIDLKSNNLILRKISIINDFIQYLLKHAHPECKKFPYVELIATRDAKKIFLNIYRISELQKAEDLSKKQLGRNILSAILPYFPELPTIEDYNNRLLSEILPYMDCVEISFEKVNKMYFAYKQQNPSSDEIKRYMAANQIRFWYSRVKSANEALLALKDHASQTQLESIIRGFRQK